MHISLVISALAVEASPIVRPATSLFTSQPLQEGVLRTSASVSAISDAFKYIHVAALVLPAILKFRRCHEVTLPNGAGLHKARSREQRQGQQRGSGRGPHCCRGSTTEVQQLGSRRKGCVCVCPSSAGYGVTKELFSKTKEGRRVIDKRGTVASRQKEKERGGSQRQLVQHRGSPGQLIYLCTFSTLRIRLQQ